MFTASILIKSEHGSTLNFGDVADLRGFKAFCIVNRYCNKLGSISVKTTLAYMHFGWAKRMPRNRMVHNVFQMSKLASQSREVSVH